MFKHVHTALFRRGHFFDGNNTFYFIGIPEKRIPHKLKLFVILQKVDLIVTSKVLISTVVMLISS